MMGALSTVGVLVWALQGTVGWETKLFVEGELASHVTFTVAYGEGWQVEKNVDGQLQRAFWPKVSEQKMREELGVQAVYRNNLGQVVQIDTEHFQHRFGYASAKLIFIDTTDKWDDHRYELVWQNGAISALNGYLERIAFRYNGLGELIGVRETWLDEPEMSRELSRLRGSPPFPMGLPISMGWALGERGEFRKNWLESWWFSKQKFGKEMARHVPQGR